MQQRYKYPVDYCVIFPMRRKIEFQRGRPCTFALFIKIKNTYLISCCGIIFFRNYRSRRKRQTIFRFEKVLEILDRALLVILEMNLYIF